MSDLGAIVKTAADDMAEGGEKAGAAIAEHFNGIGSELKGAVTRYRGVEEDGEQSFKALLDGGAQDAEHVASETEHVAEATTQEVTGEASEVTDPFRAEAGEAGSEAESLSAESEQQATEDGHEDGEGGSSEDPVDVVTGEMFLAQVDIALPGTLELVVERRHGSSYARGRCFGTRWASTLDQRIEVDEDGIHFATADGRVLHYPIPTVHGQRVVSSRGPRWPLAWNRSDDVITIEQGESGRTLHFPPGPTPQVWRPIAAVTDQAGNRVTFDYDTVGVPTDIYHSGGYHLVIESIETQGGVRIGGLKLADTDDSAGTVVREFRYDPAGRLTGVVDSSRLAMVFDYDDADRITQWTDRNGYAYRYHYRADGRVGRAEGDDGYLAVDFDYDLQARTTTLTDALGHASVYHWNERLQTVKVVDPLGYETLTEHDRYGELTQLTDALGRVTRIERDAFGDALHVHRPDGTTVATVYNQRRQPVTAVGVDGATWRYEYEDETGALSSVTGPDGARSEYRLDRENRVAESVDPLGRTTQIVLDRAGLPIEMAGPDGAATTLRRDAFGRVIEITDPLGARTKLTWSAEGRPLTRTVPGGGRETWSYDPEGNLRSYTNPAGAVTRFEYGPFDTVTARIEPSGVRYEFGYDLALNLTSVTGPGGHRWTYEYDACERLVRETDFNGATQTYTVDAAGQLVGRVNTVGQSTTTDYDLMGRVVTREAETVAYRYGYDLAGQLVRAEGPGSLVEFTRDISGRVVSETVNGRSVTSAYNPAGERVGRTTPSGVVSRWTYDDAGRPASLAGTAGSLAFDYDQAGREATRYLGPAAALTTTYDELGHITGQGVWHFDQPGTSQAADTLNRWRPLQARAYTYRADGTPTGIDDQLRGPRSFELDPAGRITAVQAAAWRETYVYDSLGNLAQANVPNGEPDSDGEREHTGTLVQRAGRTRYEHDAAGRLIRRTRVTLSGRLKEWTYTWDAEDRLTQVTTPDGNRHTYSYDPLGRRIAKTEHAADGTVRRVGYFVWDGPRLIEEIRANGARTTATTWDHDPGTFKPAAQTRRSWVDDATAEQMDQEFHAIVTDLVGTPTELVTPDGRIAWRAQASLWGQTAAVAGSTTECLLRFPGQYHDDESGLDYSYFRYYSPEDAAFLTSDPLGLTPAPNPHAYVANPLVWLDPIGLAGCPVDVTVKWEEGMPKSQFKLKADAMQKLSDDGKLYKAPNPVARDKNITAKYKSDLIKKVYAQYKDVNPSFADSMIKRVRAMNPDHVWELQLGGPDAASNLHILDAGTNQKIGSQIWAQIQNLPDKTPIRLHFEGPPG
jgi:RHS repeat-associated protein